MKEKYIEECSVIQQNCTYTAEAHHQCATSAKKKAFWLEVIPAVCAAVSSTLVAAGVSVKLLPFTILSATISAVTAVLNPNKVYQDHLAAAKNFTTLKHDARFLRESQSARLAEEALVIAVENLHQRYNELLKITPPTDKKSFEKAREIIQAGMHDPDKDAAGKIK
jgi:uncharacterized protein YsxB (DUF464 family)